MNRVYTTKGTTDDVLECGLCGRTDLKKTVIMVELDDDGNEFGRPLYFGTECAANASGWTAKEVRTQARTADHEAKEAARKQHWADHQAEMDRMDAWFLQTTGCTNVDEARKQLGGGVASYLAYLEATEGVAA